MFIISLPPAKVGEKKLPKLVFTDYKDTERSQFPTDPQLYRCTIQKNPALKVRKR